MKKRRLSQVLFAVSIRSSIYLSLKAEFVDIKFTVSRISKLSPIRNKVRAQAIVL